MREGKPAGYREEAKWFDLWRIQTMVLSGEGDLSVPLASFSRDPSSAIDEFFRVIYRLMYHGRTQELLRAMLHGLPLLRDSTGIMAHGISEYEEYCFLLSLFGDGSHHASRF